MAEERDKGKGDEEKRRKGKQVMCFLMLLQRRDTEGKEGRDKDEKDTEERNEGEERKGE